MQQLNIQDAGFIYQETANTPMHITGIAIFDQSGSSHKRMSKPEAIDYMNARIGQAPILRQKLLHTPFGMERPYWVEDPEFDINNHVFQSALPGPGTRQQLAERISDIISTPLNMARPLWEIHIIEGLNGYDGVGKNSFAMVTKIHHSCVDGDSGNNLYAAIVDLTPDTAADPAPSNSEKQGEKQPRKLPGRFEMLARAYGNNTISAIEQTSTVIKRLPSLARIASSLYRREIDPGAKLRVPFTRFNKTPETGRSMGFIDFELKAIKKIKNSVPGTTINDVMVCIVAGALRHFLAHHNELPAASLGAMLPKNIRAKKDHNKKSGNMVGGLFATIHTDIADPKQRLIAISENTKKAKHFAETADTAAIFPYMMGGFLYPGTGKKLARLMQKTRIMERIGPVIVNTIITNVAGPNFDLYHAGARQHLFLALAPLTDGIGISHGIYSYQGKVSISMVSCPSMVGDAALYMACCQKAFDELVEATTNTA